MSAVWNYPHIRPFFNPSARFAYLLQKIEKYEFYLDYFLFLDIMGNSFILQLMCVIKIFGTK